MNWSRGYKLALGLIFWGGAAWAGPQVFVTGDYRGEIKPCGCSKEGDLGGIERGSSFLKTKGPQDIWVDLGNFSAKATEQGQLKTRLLYDYFRQRKLFAALPGPLEFQKGVDGLRRFPLPYLITNQQRPFPVGARNKQGGGLSWYGYLSPSLLSKGTHQTVWLSDVQNFLAKLGKEKTPKALLFRGPKTELRAILAQAKFQLVLVGNQAQSEEEQVLRFTLGGRRFLKPPLKGQGVLVLKDVSDHQGQVHWLKADTPNDKVWEKKFQAYNQAVEKIFFAEMEGSQKKGKRVYKGAEGCISCHKRQGKVWRATRHAKAFDSLKSVGKQFDPECIRCHAAGYQSRGFVSEEITPDLVGVQCENCHGFYRPHEKGWPEKREKLNRMLCKGCHTGSHSPKFKFSAYYPKIAHENP